MTWQYRVWLVVALGLGVGAGACADEDDECKECRDWYDDCVAACDDGDEECPAGCELTAWESKICSGCSLDG